MKVIFLDFDGVLNSENYYRKNGRDAFYIDVSRMALLEGLVKKTNAEIVLTTSWRQHWDKNTKKCDATGMQLNELFKSYGMRIYDKTPQMKNQRDKEILKWLSEHKSVQSYVVFDDIPFGWGKLSPYVVITFQYKDGLDENSINEAYNILRK